MADVWDDISEMLVGRGRPGAATLTTGETGGLVGAVEAVLASSDGAGLARAAQTLEGAFREILASAPREVRDAVVGDAPGGAAALAFGLGQVSALQALVSHALAVRPGPDFLACLSEGGCARIGLALVDGEGDVADIAARTGLASGEVEAGLARMTRAGAADFRRVAGTAVHFATPPALAVLASGQARREA